MKLNGNPVALLCSDLHLTSTPPPARSKEKNWWKSMWHSVQQIKKWRRKYDVPIFCAGDVFDTWRSTPELINWALENLPKMYAIPGQHDLPYHDPSQLKKSAFWTLVEAGKIDKEFVEDRYLKIKDFQFVGYHYGEPVEAPIKKGCYNIAITHQYLWSTGNGYKNAPVENHLSTKKFPGWDVVVVGDNHKAFEHKQENTLIWNCGCLFRRKSDEINYKPRLGLLRGDGEIESIPMETDGEIIEHAALEEVQPEMSEDFKTFVQELTKLESVCLDFKTAIRMALMKKKISAGAEKFIIEALEKR